MSINKSPVFTGAATAIITPFRDNKLDLAAYKKLIEFQIDGGIDAIVVCGTTGEASTLTDDEHREMIAKTVEYVAGRVKIVAGTGSNDTAYALELSEFAKSAGADAILQVTPYYNKTTQAGLVKHFYTIADKVDLPMILYNVPGRTGMTINPETYKILSEHPNIVATKEACGKLETVIQTAHLCGDALGIYSGEDSNIVPILSVGGLGVISVLSNVVPRETHDMCKLFFEGKIKESAKLQVDFIDLIDALFCEVNPIPVKTAMKLIGLDTGEVRLPLVDMEPKNAERLKAAMKAHNLIK
ncbi:4-hydroxy-tetrahydrodipicolinate synthase [Clostridia bacterium]|nr:4-hydroxy-tetrahydrodipicolinate synthase [Clostridia bacterium]